MNVRQRVAPLNISRSFRVFGMFLLCCVLTSCGAIPDTHIPSQQSLINKATRVGIFVSAHPDDEMQMWSLLDNTPGVWPIFVYMTQGEATNHCENASSSPLAFNNPGFDQGERQPTPIPTGKGSETCKEARIESLLTFFTSMSDKLALVPGQMVKARVADVDTTALELPDGSAKATENADGQRGSLQPRVWIDAQNRGAVVVFNMGDGNVTAQEVKWAVEAVISHREEWGLANASVEFVAGNYFNDKPGCFTYTHADHKAVHDGIRAYKAAYPTQTIYLATCNSATVAEHLPVEERAGLVQTANIALTEPTIVASWGSVDDGDGKSGAPADASGNTEANADAASETAGADGANADGTEANADCTDADCTHAPKATPRAQQEQTTGTPNTAAHPYAYGWLWPGHYPLDRTGQNQLFQVHQSFVSQ